MAVPVPHGQLEHMGVNHGSAYVTVPKQFLHSADICSRLQQVGGKRVAQYVVGYARPFRPNLRGGTVHMVYQPQEALLIFVSLASWQINANRWAATRSHRCQLPARIKVATNPVKTL